MKRKREIRPLQTEADWDQYATLAINAYPGGRVTDAASRQRLKERSQKMQTDPIISVLGLFEAGEMRGIMRLYDFTMKLHGTKMLVGGVGGLGVDLLHKKEHIAYDLIQFFQEHYRAKGAALVALYPFRPDFYKQMGYGYGRKINQYRILPADLPGGNRQNVSTLNGSHRQAVAACYERILETSNGLMAQFDYELDAIFNNHNLHKLGYWENGELRGYLLFTFEPVPNGNFLRNNIIVRSLMYEDATALHGLLAFLRVQADQIERVVVNTQAEDFHLLLQDPRNGSQNLIPSVYHESNAQGVGIMYRVIDVPRLFELLADHNFGGQNCAVQINLTDSFWPVCAGKWIIAVENGRAILNPNIQPEVEISLDIAEFASLITGATTFRTLLAYGLTQISDADYTNTIHQLFYTPHKPICHTAF